MNSIDGNVVMAHPASEPPAIEPAGARPASALRTRVISAAILLPVVLALLYVGGLGFALLLALAAVLMAGEWDRLTGGTGFGLSGLSLAAGLLAILALGYVGRGDWALLALAPLALLLALLSRLSGRAVVWPVVGLIWLALPCLALLWLRMGDLGLLAVAWLFISVWSCDTGAYFAGRGIGGPRLAPRISPKKTWSGLLGGMLAAAAASALLAVAVGGTVGVGSPLLFAVLGAALALISQCGDLAESSIKRRFGVKDSGALIPGHGGILDRVDGVLFTAPVLALIVLLPDLGLLPWR